MSVWTRSRLAVAVTVVQVVLVGATLAFREVGPAKGLHPVVLLAAFLAAPFLALGIVAMRRPREVPGNPVATAVAIVGVQCAALLLWDLALVSRLGLDCAPGILGCPPREVVKSLLALLGVLFLAALGAVSLVAVSTRSRTTSAPRAPARRRA